jgi:hypothetical protein
MLKRRKMVQNANKAKIAPAFGDLPERLPTGTRITIGRHTVELVRHGKDSDDAPCYKLRYDLKLTGNQIWSIDDLNVLGAKLI